MDRRESINGSVKKDIVGILGSKTYSQLVTMQKQINSKISSGDAVDIGSLSLRVLEEILSQWFCCL